MEIDTTLLLNFMVALGIGLLIGAERERNQQADEKGTAIAGVRTFTIASLLGAVSITFDFWLLVVALACVAVLSVTAYFIQKNEDPGMTTEITLLLTVILGGLGTWLFAAQASIGFSGILFGFMGYLMTRGFHQRNLKSIALSLLAISWFGGGLLWGLVPQAHISWAGHFWGFVGGAIAARYWKS